MNLNLTLFPQAVTFTVFIWFTVTFIWPWMLRKIEERQKTIADGLAAADQGRRSLELSTRQAEKRAAQLIEEAKIAAREEGGREKAAAKAEIEQEVARAREMLREHVAG